MNVNDWDDRYVTLVLKVSDKRNPKYVVKLVIIMDYKCEMISE